MRALAWLCFSACLIPLCSSRAQSSPNKNQDPVAARKKADDPEAALERAVASAGNDRAALVRNLQEYLLRFPDAPRKPAVYRALVESCEQLNDNVCALSNAEQLVAIRPDDSEMMMVAVNLLQAQGDEHSLVRAGGYITRVLDRVEKSIEDEKPARVSQSDWKAQQDQLRVALYVLRGKIEEQQKKYDDAVKDFQASNRVIPSALAEQHLGAIAELRNDPRGAIDYYMEAFVLPESGPGGSVDRMIVRQNLTNVWREIHASDAGLAEAVLTAFDKAEGSAGAPRPAERNRDIRDPFAFVLRDLTGSPLPMAEERDKVVVLSFWATWCQPCRELEPLFARTAADYAGRDDVAFLALNTDEDESRVKPFVAEQKWTIPIFFADGLDELLKVAILPTVVVLDRNGKITYRVNGFQSEDFEERLTTAIEKTLHH
ncbi:MAG: TlpA disulfide reductase family protein [Candidatus Acidiferrales bacterium]